MLIINWDEVMVAEGEAMAEASTLGLRPGEWPDFISIVEDKRAKETSGVLYRMVERDGDAATIYRSKDGAKLVVLND